MNAEWKRFLNIRYVFGSIVIGFMGLFFLLTSTRPTPIPDLSIHNDSARGASALQAWLEQAGYAVQEVDTQPLAVPDSGILFILDPLTAYTSNDALMIRDWVRRGNTLIVAGEPTLVNPLLAPYRIFLVPPHVNSGQVAFNGPTLNSPPLEPPDSPDAYTITANASDTIHLSIDGKPILISHNEGRGIIWVSGTLEYFTNRAVVDTRQQSGNAKLILNLIARAPAKPVISFDEGRHGFNVPRSLLSWVLASPAGWGILLALLITLIYLLLRGQHFGRILPLPSDRLQREPVEYIQAMANLYRRTNQRLAILQHYREQFRRRLSERYNIDPRLSDAELVKTLVIRDPNTDEAQLRHLLERLNHAPTSEGELIRTVLDLDAWLAREL